MAIGLLLPSMRSRFGVEQIRWIVRVRGMWTQGIREGGNHLSGESKTFGFMVQGNLVGHLPKEWGKRLGAATHSRTWELPNGLGLATQAAPSDGEAGTR